MRSSSMGYNGVGARSKNESLKSLGLRQGGKEHGSWAWELALGIPQGKKLW